MSEGGGVPFGPGCGVLFRLGGVPDHRRLPAGGMDRSGQPGLCPPISASGRPPLHHDHRVFAPLPRTLGSVRPWPNFLGRRAGNGGCGGGIVRARLLSFWTPGSPSPSRDTFPWSSYPGGRRASPRKSGWRNKAAGFPFSVRDCWWALIGPVGEEVMFRGVLQQALAERIGTAGQHPPHRPPLHDVPRRRGHVCPAVGFRVDPRDPEGGFPSLWAPILFHVVNNSASVLLDLLS